MSVASFSLDKFITGPSKDQLIRQGKYSSWRRSLSSNSKCLKNCTHPHHFNPQTGLSCPKENSAVVINVVPAGASKRETKTESPDMVEKKEVACNHPAHHHVHTANMVCEKKEAVCIHPAHHHHHEHTDKCFPASKLSVVGVSKRPVSNSKTYYVVTEQHGDHVHYKLADQNPQNLNSKKLMGQNEEGCPCCNAGLDFDEFASAIKFMNHSGADLPLQGWAHFNDGGHWGIFFGVALPFGAIGLTAAYRNIKGTMSNIEKLTFIIDTVKVDIKNAEKKLKESEGKYLHKSNQQLLYNLKAFKKTLEYSIFDAKFNLVVPGIINGVASSFVLASGVWHQPWALPALFTYCMGQVGRNLFDLNRVWSRSIPVDSISEPNIHTSAYHKNSGEKSLNQIAQSNRYFYLMNAFNFTVFSIGCFVTFYQIVRLSAGRGSLTLLNAGLTMLAYGALTTAVANNIWPNKFKPRNGYLGVDRRSLTPEKCSEEIGRRREIKKVLKTAQNKFIPPHTMRRFGMKVCTALPRMCTACLPEVARKFILSCRGEKMLHENSLHRLKESKQKLAQNRRIVLKDVLNVSGFIAGDLSSVVAQWDACKRLGIDVDILNLLIKDQGCCHHEHDGDNDYSSYIHQLGHTDMFFYDNGEVKLKDVSKLNPKQQTKLVQTIDFYLYFEWIETLRYQERGLSDYYWALKEVGEQASNQVSDADDYFV
ncbi:hypothetical protein DID73_01000 [Candidatus Marinamargulisbacteria bacterium SCGC AG-343-K17]|nr:hypothetical protein DID73_01000 [Candidatus Marinamargulisbacteria bacterium SCGC AG-343-K17]